MLTLDRMPQCHTKIMQDSMTDCTAVDSSRIGTKPGHTETVGLSPTAFASCARLTFHSLTRDSQKIRDCAIFMGLVNTLRLTIIVRGVSHLSDMLLT